MSEEHLAEMHEGFEQALRTMLMAAAKIRERTAQRRADTAAAHRHQGWDTATHAEHAHAAQRAGLAAELAPVHHADWWQQARPERIARLWELSGRYAEQNDDAAAAHRHMNHQIRDRYGIDPQRVAADNRDLTTAIAAIAADEKHAAREDTAAVPHELAGDRRAASQTQVAGGDSDPTAAGHLQQADSERLRKSAQQPTSLTVEQQARAVAALDAWFTNPGGPVPWKTPGHSRETVEEMHAALEATTLDDALAAFPGPIEPDLTTPEEEARSRRDMAELREQLATPARPSRPAEQSATDRTAEPSVPTVEWLRRQGEQQMRRTAAENGTQGAAPTQGGQHVAWVPNWVDIERRAADPAEVDRSCVDGDPSVWQEATFGPAGDLGDEHTAAARSYRAQHPDVDFKSALRTVYDQAEGEGAYDAVVARIRSIDSTPVPVTVTGEQEAAALLARARDERAARGQDRDHGAADLVDARSDAAGGRGDVALGERRDAAADFSEAREHRGAAGDLTDAAAAATETPDAGYQRARASDMPTLDAATRDTRVTVAESFPHPATQLSNPRHDTKHTQSSGARPTQQKRPKRSR